MKNFSFIKYFIILSLTLLQVCVASEAAKYSYGPFLNFIDAGENNDRWNLSALVIAPSCISSDNFQIKAKHGCGDVEFGDSANPELIDTVNNYNFLRYRLSFLRDDNRSKSITYQIGGGPEFTTWIPPTKSDPHVFFGSCNKYAHTTTMWQKINQKHEENPFHLAILNGDQIYVDWGGKDNSGVFGIDSLRQIMMGDLETRMAPLLGDQKVQIDEDLEKFLFSHYCQHYSKPGFREFLATVPCKSLAGDHEYYDGFGSYHNPPPAMSRIWHAAERFYLLFQHHTTKESAEDSGLIGLKTGGCLSSYNYLLRFQTTAFFGLDTRTERTPGQVVSYETIDFMFEKLKSVGKSNIFLITEIPLVYQSVTPFYKILNFFNKSSILKYLYRKAIGSNDSRRNLDISLDSYDSWSHKSHVTERNCIIQQLVEELVKDRGEKVILLGGDVHSAGAGEVVEQLTGEVIVRQLTSSSITSSPTPKIIAWLKKLFSCFQSSESYGGGLVEKITSYSRDRDGKKSREIAFNNWLELESIDGEIYPGLWVLPSESQDLERWTPEGWSKICKVKSFNGLRLQ